MLDNPDTADPFNLPSPKPSASFRFSTDDFPEQDRLAIFREVVAKHFIRQDLEPVPEFLFYARSHVRRLPGLTFYWSSASASRLKRTREFLSDGNDNLVFQWTNAAREAEHLHRELSLGPGDGIVFSCSDPRTVVLPSAYRTMTLSIPRSALGTRLRNVESHLAKPLPGRGSTARLLLGYMKLLADESSTSTPELSEAAVTHVYDLLAIMLGATRDAAETARRRGLQAARLQAIKSNIREKLADSHLSVSGIAAKHRLTPRYVQMLFENEGITFTGFVRDERLAHAHRILTSPLSAGRKIFDIALECGFGDLSYFNRAFRARFGATPSEIRARLR